MDKTQLRQLIVETLKGADLFSEAAVELLMGTAAQESALGRYIYQINGPALGIFQMEPDTHADIYQNYLAYRPELKRTAQSVSVKNGVAADEMSWNLKYAIVMARIHYLRVPKALPDRSDVEAMAHYWKRYYNSEDGAGTVEEFIRNHKRYL